METTNIQCSMLSHGDKKALKFCFECNIFMCHQCFNHHRGLFNNKHHLLDITENSNNIFTGLCKEQNHSNKLDHFCKTHNQLCCIVCIGNNSKHSSCDICKIEDIKEEKKTNIEKNVKLLEDLSIEIKETINKVKILNEKMEKQKEEIKSKIMKTIINIRNKLNEREDELLSMLDSKFLDLYPPEKLIKEYEKLPKQINELLEKRKLIDKKLEDFFFLNSYINDCINMENDFKKIKEINGAINKYNLNSEKEIYFFPEENEINRIYTEIKSIGKIYQKKEEKSNFFILGSDEEINALNIKLKKIQNEIQEEKSKNEDEKNKLQNNLNDIKSQLDKEKNKSNNLKNQLDKSKIHFTMRSRCALNKCLDMKSLTYGNSPHLWDYGHHNANQIKYLN